MTKKYGTLPNNNKIIPGCVRGERLRERVDVLPVEVGGGLVEGQDATLGGERLRQRHADQQRRKHLGERN